ncbi:hypothetical protein AB4563_18090 [Vibrio splendidus]
MARLAPKVETIRALFARSGNQCALPGCTHPMVNLKQKFVGQICHIEAAMPQGERYNTEQSDEERRSYDNLVLLCYQHHIETDDTNEYTVQKLKQIKFCHESNFLKSDFKINESELYKLTTEMERYWSHVERLNSSEHAMEELLERLQASNDSLDSDFYKFIEKHDVDSTVLKKLSYSCSPFGLRSWEDFTLSKPNNLMQIRIDLLAIEVSYLELYLKTNSNDLSAREALELAKTKLADLAQNAILCD